MLVDIKIEGNDRAAGYLNAEKRAVKITLAAKVEEAEVRHDEEHINEGTEDGHGEQSLIFGERKLMVSLGELLHFGIFLAEHLNDLHARKILREKGVDHGRRLARSAEGAAQKLTENKREKNDKGNKAQNE